MRSRNAPLSVMSSLKSSAARRLPGAPAATGDHLPLAVNFASGTVIARRLRRHSRTPSDVRFTASISTRPSRLPASSRSSTTMSSVGTVVGWSR